METSQMSLGNSSVQPASQECHPDPGAPRSRRCRFLVAGIHALPKDSTLPDDAAD